MVLGMKEEDPSQLYKFNIGDFIRECVENFGGKGGGRKDFGQGFINNGNIDIDKVKNYIINKLKI